MKSVEFFKTEEQARRFANTLNWKEANVEIEEGYEPNDDIDQEEYERTKEEYHGWFVWYYPKPYNH